MWTRTVLPTSNSEKRWPIPQRTFQTQVSYLYQNAEYRSTYSEMTVYSTVNGMYLIVVEMKLNYILLYKEGRIVNRFTSITKIKDEVNESFAGSDYAKELTLKLNLK